MVEITESGLITDDKSIATLLVGEWKYNPNKWMIPFPQVINKIMPVEGVESVWVLKSNGTYASANIKDVVVSSLCRDMQLCPDNENYRKIVEKEFFIELHPNIVSITVGDIKLIERILSHEKKGGVSEHRSNS